MAAVILFHGFEEFTDGSLEGNMSLLGKLTAASSGLSGIMDTETRIVFNIRIMAYTLCITQVTSIRELPTASYLEVLSMSLFDCSNVEIALECTHVGKRLCPVTLYQRRLHNFI